jgi:S-adenosylmethionine/arginine decarboxylase-like enzyme
MPCDREAVRDANAIRAFCEDPVATIGMVAYRQPVVQLIQTSAVTGHFCDAGGDAYLDVFSCKDFDPEGAVAVVERHLNPTSVRKIELIRDASLA